ncbi:MAG: histidinol-phosphate transaminase [Oscillospiraceae bacterium]|nr:histidinol-phosphate transaminase [Candidatus Limimonas egerieequi]
MSKYFSNKYQSLVPYTPGEQPKDQKYNKLNTNESPFTPSPKAIEYMNEAAKNLQLYSDPDCTRLVNTACEYFGIEKDEILFTNGSDEILNFAFMAFCDKDHPAVFPDITYGFYPVFAEMNGIPYEEIPLEDDFSIDIEKYKGINKTIFIANPNAPTGIALSKGQIEEIVKSNDSVIVIDEAYVDFGAESVVELTKKYDNLLVTQTFSKSRSLAGARLGFGIGCKALIQDLNTIKYSTNPYNVNTVSMMAGVGALEDDKYMKENCKTVMANRVYTVMELERLGFEVLPSSSNFVFAKSNKIGGKELYLNLKEKGILIRHFEKDRLFDYNRITIGSLDQMKALIKAIEEEVL